MASWFSPCALCGGWSVSYFGLLCTPPSASLFLLAPLFGGWSVRLRGWAMPPTISNHRARAAQLRVLTVRRVCGRTLRQHLSCGSRPFQMSQFLSDERERPYLRMNDGCFARALRSAKPSRGRSKLSLKHRRWWLSSTRERKCPACQGGASHSVVGCPADRDISRISQPPYWWRSHGQLKASAIHRNDCYRRTAISFTGSSLNS